MSLADVSLAVGAAALPGDVRAFLREARRRVRRFQRERRHPGFVTSNFARTYAVLRALAEADVAPGDRFCEWGSGFGVVTCLAAMLGYDACGIEIEGELVDAARLLADDFGLPAEFHCGSFLPPGSAALFAPGEGFAWLATDEGPACEETAVGPADFDTIFVYPWPDEERLTSALFQRHARVGAVLLTYHGGADFRLRRQRAASAGPSGPGSRTGPS